MTFFTRIAAIASILVIAIFAGVLADELDGDKYFPDGAVDAEALIPPPPPLGSPAFNEAMAVVLWMQRTRTPEDVVFVEKSLNFDRFIPILGNDLDAFDREALEEILDDAIDEVREEYDAIKERYDYPRPFQVSDAVKPVGDARTVASYPSGHSIRATVYARLLADIFPAHASELTEFGKQIGYGRVTGGLHYPQDVISGQILGNAFADVILQQPAFEEAVLQIRSAKD